MPRYVLTQRAVQDLSEIWNYTYDRWSEQQADKYYWMLLDQCERLAKDPDVGKSYEDIDNGLRGMKVNRHIIFYKSRNIDGVEVIRILHERMDLRNRLKFD